MKLVNSLERGDPYDTHVYASISGGIKGAAAPLCGAAGRHDEWTDPDDSLGLAAGAAESTVRRQGQGGRGRLIYFLLLAMSFMMSS